MCENGQWGTCLTDAALGMRTVRVPSPFSSSIEAIGAPPAKCINTPCDPNCVGYVDTTDGGVAVPILDSGVVVGGSDVFGSNVPPGHQAIGLDPSQVCTPGCTTAACLAACQFDMHCSPTVDKACVAYGVAERDSCVGIDYTVGTACESSDGLERIIAVCNRGTQNAPAGAQCYIWPISGNEMPSDTPDMTKATLIGTTSQALVPGQCESVRIAASNTAFGNGAQDIQCQAPAGTTECNSTNNWSVTKLVPHYYCSTLVAGTPVATTVTRVFQAVCPAGSSPTWINLGYTSATPAGTQIEFRLRSFESTNGQCDPLAPVIASPPSPIATASTTGDPQVCPIGGGVSGCPKPLGPYLDFPDVNYDCLQMDARLIPNVLEGPVLYDWTFHYDCIANR